MKSPKIMGKIARKGNNRAKINNNGKRDQKQTSPDGAIFKAHTTYLLIFSSFF
jgi:hypothetical protein